MRLSSCPVATIGWLAGAGCHKGNYRPQPPLLVVRPGFSFLPPLFPLCFHLVTEQLEFGGRHYDLLRHLPMVGRWICGAEVDQRGGAAATCFCGLSACPRPGGVTRWRRPTSPSRTFPASFRLLEEDTAVRMSRGSEPSSCWTRRSLDPVPVDIEQSGSVDWVRANRRCGPAREANTRRLHRLLHLLA